MPWPRDQAHLSSTPAPTLPNGHQQVSAPLGSLLTGSWAFPGPSQPQFSGILLFSPENHGVHRSSAMTRTQTWRSKELPPFPEAQKAQSREQGL